MFYALVYFPNIQDEKYHRFRNRYDPYASLLQEHLTLVFPVPAEVGAQEFISHIHQVLGSWYPFDITISGFYKTFDHWLMLSLKEGNDYVISLHDELYTGILSQYRREDLPFTPHVGLGFFGKKEYDIHNPTSMIPIDEDKYSLALAEINEEELTYKETVDELSVLELNNSFTSCTALKTISI